MKTKMAISNKPGSLKRKPLKRSGWLNRKGPRTTLWDVFVDQERKKARDEEGLIECEDYKIGLPPCHRRVPSPDLHHTKGRDGLLLLDRSKMVWLVRECHQKADNLKNNSRPKTTDDSARPVGATPQRDALLGVQGRAQIASSRRPRRTIFSSVQNPDAHIMERKREVGT